VAKYIVFIFSDQHNPKITGFGGNEIIRTPNLDRLAAAGTSLANCYCPSPLCVPSRAALLSGLLPSKTGIFTNFQSLPSDRATFVHSLGIAGYETVLCGRMHFVGPDQRQGYEKRLVGDITSPFVGGGFDLGFLDKADEQSRVALEKAGPGNSSVLDYDREVFDQARVFLQRRHTDRPLFLTVGLYGPHCPYVCPPDLFKYYHEHLTSTDTWTDFKRTVHPAVQKWYANRGISDFTPKEIRRAQAGYYGMIELMDGMIGEFVETIDKTLGFENTLVIYASDHGDMAGDKGLFGKTNFYEGTVRVPMVFSQPGLIRSGRRIEQLTSLLDLGPTLIDYTGGPELPETDGENLLSLLEGETPENPDRFVVSQLGELKGDSPSAMIRKGPWKLVHHHGYKEPQLFNLAQDPEETNDLGGRPDSRSQCDELAAEFSRNWDSGQVLDHIAHLSLHVELLKRWFQRTKPETYDQWIGKPENNYLVSED